MIEVLNDEPGFCKLKIYLAANDAHFIDQGIANLGRESVWKTEQ
ncbi:MAG: hypothetical protein R3240_12520 [Gammaproteobacteria bacterium]|nr:hypothetical protein [Gammaproteobacteria bacterium]